MVASHLLMVNRKDSPLANLPSLLASFHIALDKHVGLSTASSWKQNAHKRDGDDANVHVTVVNHVECKKMPTLRNNLESATTPMATPYSDILLPLGLGVAGGCAYVVCVSMILDDYRLSNSLPLSQGFHITLGFQDAGDNHTISKDAATIVAWRTDTDLAPELSQQYEQLRLTSDLAAGGKA